MLLPSKIGMIVDEGGGVQATSERRGGDGSLAWVGYEVGRYPRGRMRTHDSRIPRGGLNLEAASSHSGTGQLGSDW